MRRAARLAPVALSAALLASGASACRPKPKAKKVTTTAPAAPLPITKQPDVICAWGTSAGLPPSMPWAAAGAEWSCMSKGLEVSERARLRYYAKGARTDVQLAYLVLTVDNDAKPADAKRGQEEIADAFRSVLRAGYSEELTQGEHETIRAGKDGTTLMGGRRVTRKREPSVAGKGYEYRVELEVK